MAITSNIYGSHNIENFSFSGNIGSLYAVANFVPNSPNLAQFRLYRSIDDYIPYENTNAIFTSNFVDRISNRLTINDFYGFKFFIDYSPNASSEDPYMDITYYGDVLPTEPMPNPSTDIDLNSGFFETDLQTNITKYFAESFKLKASDFELVDGVVQINPEKLASITVDLTHIVNTSVETQNLTATNATLENATATNLTATTSSLGEATANSMTASDITATNSTLGDAKADTIEVKNDGLIIEDAEGHKHKFGFTA